MYSKPVDRWDPKDCSNAVSRSPASFVSGLRLPTVLKLPCKCTEGPQIASATESARGVASMRLVSKVSRLPAPNIGCAKTAMAVTMKASRSLSQIHALDQSGAQHINWR